MRTRTASGRPGRGARLSRRGSPRRRTGRREPCSDADHRRNTASYAVMPGSGSTGLWGDRLHSTTHAATGPSRAHICSFGGEASVFSEGENVRGVRAWPLREAPGRWGGRFSSLQDGVGGRKVGRESAPSARSAMPGLAVALPGLQSPGSPVLWCPNRFDGSSSIPVLPTSLAPALLGNGASPLCTQLEPRTPRCLHVPRKRKRPWHGKPRYGGLAQWAYADSASLGARTCSG